MAFHAIPSSLAKNTTISKQGNYRFKVDFNNSEREYVLYVPKNFKADQSYPVIINFHGGGANANAQAKFSKMNQTADKYGFLVVYPEGTPSLLLPNLKTWNSGNCCGRAQRIKVDDVAFTNAVIEDLKTRLSVDTKRIYATGMSNGAMMAHKVGCELSEKIAAIAPVGGTLNIDSCNPVRPMSVIHFHGKNDTFCPYNGGVGEKSVSRAEFKSVTDTIDSWKKTNFCPDRPRDIFQTKTVKCLTYAPCKDNAEVKLCTILNGGHTWPGGNTRIPQKLGTINKDINANELMWKFFTKHTLP